jgi:hypothetical protein
MRTASVLAALLSVAAAYADQPSGSPAVGSVAIPAQGEYASIDTKPSVAAIRTLAGTVGHENDSLVGTIVQNSGSYNPPVLFALAALLYRQGNIDAAVFWLNAARMRATFDAQRCTDVSARSAVGELVRQMPRELIVAQFRDRNALLNTIDRVIAWDDSTPEGYDPRWISLHGVQAIQAGMGMRTPGKPLTVPAKQWPALRKSVHNDLRAGMMQAFDQYQAATTGAAAAPLPTPPPQPASPPSH